MNNQYLREAYRNSTGLYNRQILNRIVLIILPAGLASYTGCYGTTEFKVAFSGGLYLSGRPFNNAHYKQHYRSGKSAVLSQLSKSENAYGNGKSV